MKSIITPIILAAFAAIGGQAQAQVNYQTVVPLTVSTNAVAGSATATVTSQAFTPNPKTGFAVFSTVLGTASTDTNAVTFKFQASADGKSWTTTYPFTATVTTTGTNAVTDYFNVAAPIATNGVGNARYIRLGAVQNANTNAITLGTIQVLRSNAAQ